MIINHYLTTFLKGSTMKELTTTQATLQKDEYLAIVDKTGEHLIAFVTPAKGVNVSHFINAMADKGINVVLNKRDNSTRTFEL